MKNQSQHKLATISFATVIADGVDLWPTISPCDYMEANRIGRARAAEIMQYAAKNQAPMVLGHVTEAIISKGTYGPAETGFFHALATQCLESSNIPISELPEVPVVQNDKRPVLKLVPNLNH